MKKLYSHIFEYAKTAVIFALLLALTVSGAGAAERVITQAQTEDEIIETVITDPVLEQGPIPAEELPGNMENPTKPNCEQAAFLQSYSTTQLDNNSCKIKIRFSSGVTNPLPVKDTGSGHSLCCSLAQVSTVLSHQHTLVGHKPSGTI